MIICILFVDIIFSRILSFFCGYLPTVKHRAMCGGGVGVHTRVCDRVVICTMCFIALFLSLCVCAYSKHRAITLRSNLQRFNRPGKEYNGDREKFIQKNVHVSTTGPL